MALLAATTVRHALQISSLSLVRPAAAAAVRLLPQLARARSTPDAVAAAPRSAQPTLSKAVHSPTVLLPSTLWASTVSSSTALVLYGWPPAQLDGRTSAARALSTKAATGKAGQKQQSPLEGLRVMRDLQAQWAAGDVGKAGYSASAQQPEDDPWRSSDPRYLGSYPELIQLAEQSRDNSSQPIRKWLRARPALLKVMGINSLEEFKRCDIDHILPDSKCGLSHPCNYYLMPRRDNQHFGDRINREKREYVSFRVWHQVMSFHVLRVAGAWSAEASLGINLSLSL